MLRDGHRRTIEDHGEIDPLDQFNLTLVAAYPSAIWLARFAIGLGQPGYGGYSASAMPANTR